MSRPRRAGHVPQTTGSDVHETACFHGAYTMIRRARLTVCGGSTDANCRLDGSPLAYVAAPEAAFTARSVSLTMW